MWRANDEGERDEEKYGTKKRLQLLSSHNLFAIGCGNTWIRTTDPQLVELVL